MKQVLGQVIRTVLKINTSKVALSSKLTLRLDESLIAAAKVYAHSQGRSLSVLVADYFAQFTHQAQPVNPPAPVGKITASLRGALAGSNVDESDYQQYLQAKHQ